MPKPLRPTVTTTMRLPKALLASLSKLALKRAGMSRTRLVEEILAAYVEDNAPAPRPRAVPATSEQMDLFA